MKATLVYNDSDWEALYIDGECFIQDHRIDAILALEAAGIETESIRSIDFEEYEDGYSPANLSDVIREELE